MAVASDLVEGEWGVVTLTDEARPGLTVTLRFASPGPTLAGVSVEGELSPEVLRRLPWSTWERTAKARVMERLRSDHQRIVELAGFADQVAALHPEVSDRRSARAHLRLARVAEEYRQNLVDGLSDPVGAIARAHGVKPGTARAWVHRARKEGYLGPASGPVAGEERS